MKRPQPPFELEIERLGPRGVGVGTHGGAPVHVRGAPPGARVLVAPAGRKGPARIGRRLALVRPPPEPESPPCPWFGVCGGCVWQELGLDAQRRHKAVLAREEIEAGLGAAIREPTVVGLDLGYGQRNKLELAFGVRRWFTAADGAAAAGSSQGPGRYLGFHPPGRFDRIVDLGGCLHGCAAMNAVIDTVRRCVLVDGQPDPWDPVHQTGFWRHLVVRAAGHPGPDGRRPVLVAVHTRPGERAPVAALAHALRAIDRPDAAVTGVVWVVDPGTADAALGDAVEVFGAETFEERIGPVQLTVSRTSFLQTSKAGAELLYGVIADLLPPRGRRLLDLYCGLGSIGLFVASRFESVLGVEIVEAAVVDARRNAARMGVAGQWIASPVEAALDRVVGGDGTSIVVDPPRVGLHPAVARALAQTPGDVLVYVACHPGSLGRDAAILVAGGWSLREVVIVDLFPQTAHVEAVARFVRTG